MKIELEYQNRIFGTSEEIEEPSSYRFFTRKKDGRQFLYIDFLSPVEGRGYPNNGFVKSLCVDFSAGDAAEIAKIFHAIASAPSDDCDEVYFGNDSAKLREMSRLLAEQLGQTT